ncbi:hypothetical protein ACFLV6_02095 [Chloroflexota bacterium]
MAKRVKKPPVPAEIIRDWLRRNEEYGETPPILAEKDGYDVRTVRTHLENARRERDQKQTRISFVKDNLEKHHQDLCKAAENLLSQVPTEKVIDMDFAENLYLEAIRQHIQRSPLWNKIRARNNTLAAMEKIKEKTNNRLKRSLKKTKLNNIKSDEAQGVVNAAVAVLVHQFEQWTRSRKGLDNLNDWPIEDRKDGKISPAYGFSHFGRILESELPIIKGAIVRYEKRMKNWSEYQEMKKQVTTLNELNAHIRKELRGIIIRRVLPGSCEYCPI